MRVFRGQVRSELVNEGLGKVRLNLVCLTKYHFKSKKNNYLPLLGWKKIIFQVVLYTFK